MSRHCKGNTTRLIALMDGSLRPKTAERLREHMVRCPGCTEAYRRIVSAQQLCQEMGEEDAPDVSWRRIEAQLHWRMAQDKTQERRQVQPRRRLVFALGLTGALVVGMLVGAMALYQIDARGGLGPLRLPPLLAHLGRTEPAPDTLHVVAAPSRVEELAAVVTLAQGEVYQVSGGGRMAPLDLNRPLLQGERAITRMGRVALQWAEGTGLRMNPDSEVELEQLETGNQRLVVWDGTIFFNVAKRRSDQRFEVLSHGVRSVVRGTHLSMGHDKEGITVEVYEGLVFVEPTSKRWKGLEVPAGYRVHIQHGSDTTPTLDRTASAPEVGLINLQPWTGVLRVLGTTGLLALESAPEGADLVVDSRPVGTTNIMVRGTLQNHLVELYREGVLLERKWVDFRAVRDTVLFEVEKAPRPEPEPGAELMASFTKSSYQQRMAQIRSCYERELKRDPELRGSITLRVTVNRKGRVVRTSLDRATLTDAGVKRCALSKASRWEFPAGGGSGAYDIVQTFQLSPR